MKKRVIIIFVLFFGGILAFNSFMDQNKYVSDFHFLVKTMEKDYPLFIKNGTSSWLEEQEKYEDQIKECKNDQEFFELMQKYLLYLGDSHTKFLDNDTFNVYYNLKDYFYDCGMFKNYDLLTDPDTLKRYKKKEVVSNDLDRKKVLQASDNNLEVGFLGENVGYISVKEMLATFPGGYGFEQGKKDRKLLSSYVDELTKKENPNKILIVDVRGNGGGDSRYGFKFLLPYFIGDSKNEQKTIVFLRNKEVLKAFSGDNKRGKMYKSLSYEKLKKMSDEFTFLKEDEEIFQNILRDFDYISDVLIEKVEDTQKKDLLKDYKLYFLVDRECYSATESMISFIKENEIGTLVGGATGGGGFSSDPILYQLPKTKYLFSMSPEASFHPGDSIEDSIYTKPDIYIKDPTKRVVVKEDSIDYSKDQCVQKILEIEKIED